MAKDIYHDIVKAALEKDEWIVTNEQLRLKIGRRSIFIDIVAEKLIAAERKGQKIAVEVKSFVSASPIHDLEEALGQFILYSKVLNQQEPDRILYLAVNRSIFQTLFSEEVGQLLLATTDLRLIVFEPQTQEIVQWIP